MQAMAFSQKCMGLVHESVEMEAILDRLVVLLEAHRSPERCGTGDSEGHGKVRQTSQRTDANAGK